MLVTLEGMVIDGIKKSELNMYSPTTAKALLKTTDLTTQPHTPRTHRHPHTPHTERTPATTPPH